MRIGTAGQNRAGATFHRAALRVCCALAALLLAVLSAAAETAPTREERLAAARKKYNTKTVHVYVRGQGQRKKGMFNVCFYRTGKGNMGILIPESLQITDETEMEAVLEVVVKHKYYSEKVYGPVSFMKAQWIAHNLAYDMATGSEEQQELAGKIIGQSSKEIIRHAKELDLSPYAEITEEQRVIYEFMEYFYCENGS